MKRIDLKAGEVYAVRRAVRPHLLLSTEVITWAASTRNPHRYAVAPAGTKPRRDPNNWQSTRTHHGFLTLEAYADVLAQVDVEMALSAILAGGREPDDTRIRLVTESAAFLAPYAVQVENEQRELDARAARLERERAAREAAHARHNRVARRINEALGEHVPHKSDQSTPTHVAVPLAQAEEIADLLEMLRPPKGEGRHA
jgi:hypothetical protein